MINKLRELKYWLLVVLFLLFNSLAYSQFADNFSDGDFTNNPSWSGDDLLFTITSGELNSQSSSAATYYLSTPSALSANAEWIFDINLKFSTSGANYVDVFLMADAADLTTAQNGYFVRIGSTQDDFKLYNLISGTPSIIIDGPDGLVNSSSNNPFQIKVTRNPSDSWELLYDDGSLGSFSSAGSAVDNNINSSSFFGILIEQSSAAGPINNHYFDNFYCGVIGADTQAPTIDSVLVVDVTHLDVYFNEVVEINTAQTLTNYSADNGLGNPSTAVRNASDSSIVHLTFSTPFVNGLTNNLTTTNVEDNSGNAITSLINPFTYVVIIPVNYGDVVINEIFADPSPQVGLPNEEFVELYNTTSNTYNLSGWSFVNTTTAKTLPNFVLMPNSYVILCNSSDTSLYTSYGDVIGISSFSALTNGGDSLTLMDNNSAIVDIVSYDISWYNSSTKDDGGYSLELINPTHPCGSSNNWSASNSSIGGTPSTQNSIFDNSPDIQNPTIENVTVISSTQIEVLFNETMDSLSLANALYTLNGGINVSVNSIYSNLLGVQLTLDAPLASSILYTLTINGVTDCSGNVVSPNSYDFALPEQGNINDIVINEVLFNPYNGGSDFVELYNNSNKYISLENWKLANLDNDSIDNYKTISSISYLLKPQEFVLLSVDVANVKQNYINAHEDVFLQMASLPTYSNDEGSVYLLNNNNEVVDYFNYNEDMHFALLNSEDGVSLERIDYNRPTNDASNWHSAAESVGFATPGYENSQYLEAETGDEITISPESFSPDNDGFEDVLNITYQFNEPGYVANIIIYDAKGRLIKNLVQNEYLGVNGTFSWDGINENNEKAAIGIYIVYAEIFTVTGDVKKFKKPCVVAGRLN